MQSTHDITVPTGSTFPYRGDYTFTGLSASASGTHYVATLTACRPTGHTDCAEPKRSKAVTLLTKLATPTNLDVVPMGNRVARIKWDAVTQPSATRYVITDNGTPPGQFTVEGVTYYDVKLDDYLKDAQADTFTVYAHRTGGNYLDSAPSAAIKIIDNPITRADGNSKDVTGGQVNVTWRVPGDTTDLTFQHLDLGGDHTGTTWTPSLSGQWSDKSAPMNYADSATIPITGLTLGNIYAITATYFEADGTKVYSGRPVYAWTAKDKPAPDARVATYPYFGHWPDKTYRYRICAETFPAIERSNWTNIIEDAFRTMGNRSTRPDHYDARPGRMWLRRSEAKETPRDEGNHLVHHRRNPPQQKRSVHGRRRGS